MLKYTIYETSNKHSKEASPNAINWINDMLSTVKKNGMEDEMRRMKAGQCLVISFNKLDDENTICYYFRCTGHQKGHFTQRIEEANGMCSHSDSLEFTYE